MKQILELVILGELPKSPNLLLGAPWQVRAGYAKRWLRFISNALATNRRLAPCQKAKVTLTRYGTRKLDSDNLRSSFKCILDALKKCGVIVDDSPDVIGTPEVIFEKVPRKETRIKVRVEEV